MKRLGITKRDILLLCGVLLLSLLLLLLRRGGGDMVRVYVDDALYATLPLHENTTLRIEQDDGRVNEVILSDGAAYMAHSTCPGQDCVKQGALTPDNTETRALGRWIICLPNRVSVELAGDE